MLKVKLHLILRCLTTVRYMDKISYEEYIGCPDALKIFIENTFSRIPAQEEKYQSPAFVKEMELVFSFEKGFFSNIRQELFFLLDYFGNNESLFTRCSDLKEFTVRFEGYSSEYRQDILNLLFIMGQAIARHCWRIEWFNIEGITEPTLQFANFISDTLSKCSTLDLQAPLPWMPLGTVNEPNRFDIAIHIDKASCARDWLSRIILLIKPNTAFIRTQPSQLQLEETALFAKQLLTITLPNLELSLRGFDYREISILLTILQNNTLKTLRLSNRGCTFYSKKNDNKEGWFLKESLPNCQQLYSLRIDCHALDKNLGAILAWTLPQLPVLSTLFLEGNCYWPTQQIETFTLSLPKCHQLTNITIAMNAEYYAFKLICDVLPQCENLRELTLGSFATVYNPPVLDDLITLIPQLFKLLILSMNSRFIIQGGNSGAVLAAALLAHPTLEHVQFSRQCIDGFSSDEQVTLTEVHEKLELRRLVRQNHLTLIVAERRSRRNTQGSINGPNNSRLFLPSEIHEYIRNEYLSPSCAS